MEKGTNRDKIVVEKGTFCLLIEKTRICSNFLAKVTENYRSLKSTKEQFVVPEFFSLPINADHNDTFTTFLHCKSNTYKTIFGNIESK